MKKVCGFAMFWMAAGMFLMLLLPGLVWEIVIMLSLLCASFRLFCC